MNESRGPSEFRIEPVACLIEYSTNLLSSNEISIKLPALFRCRRPQMFIVTKFNDRRGRNFLG